MDNVMIKAKCQRGFTLIETMVTLVIAMVIVAGLLLNFTSQSSQYKYQGKRGDAAQDLDFVLQFIANDIRSALIPKTLASLSAAPASWSEILTVAPGANTTTSTVSVSFLVWDEVEANSITAAQLAAMSGTDSTNVTNKRIQRFYQYVTPVLSYDREYVVDQGPQAILGDDTDALKGLKVTHFRIFQDLRNDTERDSYENCPPPLPAKMVNDTLQTSYWLPAITVLIEVEIDAMSQGVAKDVLGGNVTTGKRRIWRYVQVHPNVVVD